MGKIIEKMQIFNFSTNKKLTLLKIILISVAISDLHAQPAGREIVNQPIQWFAITTTMRINDRINIYADTHLRYVESLDPMQYQLRIAGEWVISKKIAIIPLGYVYVRNFLYGKQPTTFENNEHRIYQQAILTYSSGKFGFNHRFRLEERLIQTHSLNQSGEVIDGGFDDNKQLRFRYRGVITYPLNKEKIEAKTLFAMVYDELFVSWGKQVTFHKPDQNRIFVGLGYQFTNDISLQSGLFYQMLIKANGAKQENNVGINTQFNYNFDLSKKKN